MNAQVRVNFPRRRDLCDALRFLAIDAVEAAGDDQTLNDADVFGAEFGPAEEP